MTRLKASQTRIPANVLEGVADKGKRVRIDRNGGESVYLVSERDLALLEELEDKLDLREAEQALSRHKASGGKTVPLEVIEQRLGM